MSEDLLECGDLSALSFAADWRREKSRHLKAVTSYRHSKMLALSGDRLTFVLVSD
jgi:hypothetical protein